jgi:hypothetical protein
MRPRASSYSSTAATGRAVRPIVLAGIEPDRVYRFCLALALSALLCITIWSFVPSFGAFSVYALPDAKMDLALNSAYAQELLRLLREGPGLISPHNAKGLIGFPSYHAVAGAARLLVSARREIPALAGPGVEPGRDPGDPCSRRSSFHRRVRVFPGCRAVDFRRRPPGENRQSA